MVSRRKLLLGAGGSAVLLGGGFGLATAHKYTFRRHRSPQREPFLTDDHLTSLMLDDSPAPRVLFVGNSMVIRNDFPSLVAQRAADDGIMISPATAAADGARLVETMRITNFQRLLTAVKWDVVVLQDFTKTALRSPDRWGSSWAIREIADLTGSPIVLYPTFPYAAGHKVYQNAGRLTTTPDDPADFAGRVTAHYSRVASRIGAQLVPVPDAWQQQAQPEFYANDGLHPSAKGSAFIASLLWPAIKASLRDT